MQTETIAQGLAYPECPRWHDGSIWLSDQHNGSIVRVDPGGGWEEVAKVEGEPAGLGWAPDGTFLVVSMHDHRLMAATDDGFETVADLSDLHPGLSNELVVDAAGRAYVGNIGFDFYGGETPRPTVVVVVGDDRVARVAADGLLVPNGMVIVPDGDVLIVAESFAHRLTAFDVEGDGSLVNRRVFADLGEDIPDGICLDAEGAVWYASIGHHEVVRVLPGGEVAGRVSTGEQEAVACMLGGDNRDLLYVCTTLHLDPDHSVPALSGRLEVAQVEVPGAGLP